MPLVFVHGVNNRMGAAYREAEQRRNAYFSQFALRGIMDDPTPGRIVSPYWGDLGANFAWNHACLPGEVYENFGDDDDIFVQVVEELGLDAVTDDETQFLLTLARTDLRRAIDVLLTASALSDTPREGEDEIAIPLARIAEVAMAYADSDPVHAWVRNGAIQDDLQFVDELLARVEAFIPTESGTERFGIGDAWNHISGAAYNVRNAAKSVWKRGAEIVDDARESLGEKLINAAGAAAGALTNPFVRAAKPRAHQRFAYFVGDVFVYLDGRGSKGAEGPINSTVGDALQNATEQATETDPFILVAHSMGGNICYDILTHFRPDIRVDLFLTVGSQVGFFEEMKLFRASDPQYSITNGNRVPKPVNVKKWINVFDPVDPFGYAVERIFEGATDLLFYTTTHVASAHGMYFFRPHFHQRFGVRIREAMA